MPRPSLAAIESGRPIDGYEALDAETAELNNAELRKRERPFVMPLDPGDPEPVERAAYDAAYKGVTDVLTLYLWRKPAFYLTRWAARAGLAPNFVTLIGAVLLRARLLSCSGAANIGWASRRASSSWCSTRSTGSSRAAPARRRNGAMSFDHGIDLVHPPFWWWAWMHGLAAYGRPLEPVYATMVLWAIVGGYVAQRHDRGHFHQALRRDANPRLAAASTASSG